MTFKIFFDIHLMKYIHEWHLILIIGMKVFSEHWIIKKVYIVNITHFTELEIIFGKNEFLNFIILLS